MIGFLRILLALSVVITHSGTLFGYRFLKGSEAVEIFFVISGFYISLVLIEKYKNYRAFITNRFIKLYPTYIVSLFLTIILLAGVLTFFNTSLVDSNAAYFKRTADYFLNDFGNLSIISRLFILFVNISMFFQDSLTFFGLGSENNVSGYLLIAPAWAISLELLFYLIAPFIVKRNTLTILGLICVGLIFRYLIYLSTLNTFVWNYLFFPAQLPFFLAGCISYRLYSKFKMTLDMNEKNLKIISIFVILITIFYQFIPNFYTLPTINNLKFLIYILLIVITLPAMHITTNRYIYINRILSDISYPIYLLHMSVAQTLLIANVNLFNLGSFTAILSIIISLVLTKFIIIPIDRFRQKRI